MPTIPPQIGKRKHKALIDEADSLQSDIEEILDFIYADLEENVTASKKLRLSEQAFVALTRLGCLVRQSRKINYEMYDLISRSELEEIKQEIRLIKKTGTDG